MRTCQVLMHANLLQEPQNVDLKVLPRKVPSGLLRRRRHNLQQVVFHSSTSSVAALSAICTTHTAARSTRGDCSRRASRMSASTSIRSRSWSRPSNCTQVI